MIFGTRIKAESVNYSSVQYRLFYYEFDGDEWNQGSTSYTNAGTSINNMQYKPVWAWNTQINMGNQTLVAGRTYKITMTYTMQPANNYLFQNYRNEIYWDNPVGTGNSNGSNLSEDNIDRFSATWQPNCQTCARNSVVYYVTPAVDLKVLQVRLRIRSNNYALTGTDPSIGFTTFNQPAGDYIKITYTTDESAIAIQEQTTIIEQQTDEIIEAITGDYDYNDDPSETIQGADTIDDYTDEETELLEGLTLEVEEAEVTINPYASGFIWEIVNRLRGMNPKIVLLFTSALSLGLIKMVLNR